MESSGREGGLAHHHDAFLLTEGRHQVSTATWAPKEIFSFKTSSNVLQVLIIREAKYCVELVSLLSSFRDAV